MRRDLLHILQHSLGLDKYGQGEVYRNHFCAGGVDLPLCRELADMEYMREYTATEISGGDPTFTVTIKGAIACVRESPAPPKLTRSQKRYRQFLRADTGRPFGEWLKDQAEYRKRGAA